MNMIWLQISSLVYLSILFFVYISKERVKSLENKIFKSIMIANIVGLVIELGCFMTVINMDKIPVINSIVTKLLLVYYLTYILLFTAYVFVISYRKDGKSVIYSLDDEHVNSIFSVGLSHIKHKLNI